MTASQAAPSQPQPPAPTHFNREHSHLPFLDGLRGSLAFWVMAGHTMAESGLTLPLLSRAQLAVDIFMLVSGFLMAFYFRLREDREPWEAPATWGGFYIRRFFRIAPAYYLIVTIAFIFRAAYARSLFNVMSVFPPAWASLVHMSPALPPLGFAEVASHFTFLFGFIPAYASDNVVPDWSIGLEMQFYMALPFIMLLFRRAGHILSTVVLLGVWIAAIHLIGVFAGNPAKLLGHFPQPTFLPLKLNCFLVGILLAESYHFLGLNRAKSALLFLMSLAIAYATSSKLMAGVVCGCALLLAYRPSTAARGPARLFAWLQRGLDSRPFAFLGDTSYGVYLLHNLFLVPFAAWMLTHPAFVHLAPLKRYGIMLGCVACFAYPAAYLVHRFIERPGIALGRKFIRRARTAAPHAGTTHPVPVEGTAPDPAG